MQTEGDAKAIALTLGFISGIHRKLHEIREGQSEEDERDIDSAQVLLECASQKLTEVLNRHRPIPDVAFWADVKSKTESEED